MSDEPDKPLSLEEAARVDQDALQHWFSIPAEAPVVLNASRADMDALFLGLRHALFMQGATLAAFQLYTHGELDKANEQFNKAAAQHIDALAQITRFTSAIMAKAEVHE